MIKLLFRKFLFLWSKFLVLKLFWFGKLGDLDTYLRFFFLMMIILEFVDSLKFFFLLVNQVIDFLC